MLFISSSVNVLSFASNSNEYAILFLFSSIPLPVYTSNTSVFNSNEPADFFISVAISAPYISFPK